MDEVTFNDVTMGKMTMEEVTLIQGPWTKYAKYGIWGAYSSAQNMVEWGVPEKTSQNAVQMHWSYAKGTTQSKFITKSHFARFPYCSYFVKRSSLLTMDDMTMGDVTMWIHTNTQYPNIHKRPIEYITSH